MGHPGKLPGFARRTVEGGCPHITPATSDSLYSQGFLNLRRNSGREGLHLLF